MNLREPVYWSGNELYFSRNRGKGPTLADRRAGIYLPLQTKVRNESNTHTGLTMVALARKRFLMSSENFLEACRNLDRVLNHLSRKLCDESPMQQRSVLHLRD